METMHMTGILAIVQALIHGILEEVAIVDIPPD